MLRLVAPLLLIALLLPASARGQSDLPIRQAPEAPDEGELVSFGLAGYGTGEEVRWDFGDGETFAGTGRVSVSHRYADDGTYTVTSTVPDGEGGTLRGAREVTIANTSPSIQTITGDLVSEDLTVELNAVAVDPGEDDLTYRWDFGDDRTGEGRSVTHTYREHGKYTVRLTVTDGDGGSDSQPELVGAGVQFVATLGGRTLTGRVEPEGGTFVLGPEGDCTAAFSLVDEEEGSIVIDFSKPHFQAGRSYETDQRSVIRFDPPEAARTGEMWSYHTDDEPSMHDGADYEVAPGWLSIDYVQPATNEDRTAIIVNPFYDCEANGCQPGRLEGRIAAQLRKWTVKKAPTDPWDGSWNVYTPVQYMNLEARFAAPAGWLSPSCILPRTGDGLHLLHWGETRGDATETSSNEHAPSRRDAVPPTGHFAHRHGPSAHRHGPSAPADLSAGRTQPSADRDWVSDGSKNVDFERAGIRVYFDDDISESSVRAETFRLETMLTTGVETVDYQKTVRGNVVELVPTSRLRSGTLYRVVAEGGPQGLSGRKVGEEMDETHVIHFETAVEVDSVNVHVFQVARDMPLVAGKEAAVRVYVNWEADAEVDSSWQVTSFPAFVSLSGALERGRERVEIKRPDLFSEQEKREKKNSINFFEWRPTVAGGDRIEALVEPITEGRGSNPPPERGISRHTIRGVNTLTYANEVPSASYETYSLAPKKLVVHPYVVRAGAFSGGISEKQRRLLETAMDKFPEFTLQNLPFTEVEVAPAQSWTPADLKLEQHPDSAMQSTPTSDLFARLPENYLGEDGTRHVRPYWHLTYLFRKDHPSFARGTTHIPILFVDRALMPENPTLVQAACIRDQWLHFYYVGDRVEAEGAMVVAALKEIVATAPVLTHEVVHCLGIEGHTVGKDLFAHTTLIDGLEPGRQIQEGLRIDLDGSGAQNKSLTEGNEGAKRLFELMWPATGDGGTSFSFDEQFITNKVYELVMKMHGYWPEGAADAPDPSPPPTQQPSGSGPSAPVAPRVEPLRTRAAGEQQEVRTYAVLDGLLAPSAEALTQLEVTQREGMLLSDGEEGSYTVEVVDADGVVLARTRAQAVPLRASHTPPDDAAPRRLLAAVAFPPESRALVVRRGGETLAHLRRSDHAPTVRITAPSEGARWRGRHTLQWEGDDADGDALRYDVSYRAAPDRAWRPLATGLTRGEFEVDASEFLPGPEPTLRVVASDGLDRGEESVQIDLGRLLQPVRLHPVPEDTTATSTGISAAFYTELRPETFDHETFTLVDAAGREVVADVRYEPALRAAVLTPHEPLWPDMRYTATLGAGVRNVYGNRLEAPVTWSFRTARQRIPEGEANAQTIPDPPTRPVTSSETEAEQEQEEKGVEDEVRGLLDRLRDAVEETTEDREGDGG